MESTYCQDGCCKQTIKEGPRREISNKVIISGYALYVVALGALIWYEASIGIFIDASLI